MQNPCIKANSEYSSDCIARHIECICLALHYTLVKTHTELMKSRHMELQVTDSLLTGYWFTKPEIKGVVLSGLPRTPADSGNRYMENVILHIFTWLKSPRERRGSHVGDPRYDVHMP